MTKVLGTAVFSPGSQSPVDAHIDGTCWSMCLHFLFSLNAPALFLWKARGQLSNWGCDSLWREVVMCPGSWEMLPGLWCTLYYSGEMEGECHCSLEVWLGFEMRLAKSTAARSSISTVNLLNGKKNYWNFLCLHNFNTKCENLFKFLLKCCLKNVSTYLPPVNVSQHVH